MGGPTPDLLTCGQCQMNFPLGRHPGAYRAQEEAVWRQPEGPAMTKAWTRAALPALLALLSSGKCLSRWESGSRPPMRMTTCCHPTRRRLPQTGEPRRYGALPRPAAAEATPAPRVPGPPSPLAVLEAGVLTLCLRVAVLGRGPRGYQDGARPHLGATIPGVSGGDRLGARRGPEG